jgi:hypothetical protein
LHGQRRASAATQLEVIDAESRRIVPEFLTGRIFPGRVRASRAVVPACPDER